MLPIPLPELPSQMSEFKSELPICNKNLAHSTSVTQFAPIERESPANRLEPDYLEITVDRADRRCLRVEPLKLRMMTISSGSSLENALSEEAFPPERDEAD